MFRTNVILAAVALVLAIPTAWTLYRDRTVFTAFEDLPRLFDGFTRDNVFHVLVSQPRRGADGALVRDEKGAVVRDALLLSRSTDDWVINGDASEPLLGVPVPSARVYERVLQHFESIRRDGEALIQADASNQDLARYGLGADEALSIQCLDAQQKPVAELYVGDDASRGQAGEDVVRGYFVRSRDSNDVVLYEQPCWVVGVDRAQWYERSPLRFDVDQAVEVSVVCPKGRMRLTKADPRDPDWTVAEAPGEVGAVRNTEIRGLLESVSLLNVASWVRRLPDEPSERQALLAEHGLGDPGLWVEVALADGTRHRIAFGSSTGANERYALVSSLDFLMTVADWVPARFEKSPADTYFDPRR